MDVSNLWSFSVLPSLLFLICTIFSHNVIPAWLLLFFTFINILDKVNAGLYYVKMESEYRKEFYLDNTLSNGQRRKRILFMYPSPFSVNYIIFCIGVGSRYSIYTVIKEPALSYVSFCCILVVEMLIYEIFSLLRTGQGEINVLPLVYDFVLSVIIAIPAGISFTKSGYVNRYEVSGFLWYILFLFLIWFIFILKELYIKRREGKKGRLLFVKKLSFIPIYYIGEDINTFWKSYHQNVTDKKDWLVNLSCNEKRKIISREMLSFFRILPSGRIYITETHDELIRFAQKKTKCIVLPAFSRKVDSAFRIIYGKNWEKMEQCKECTEYKNAAGCPVAPKKRRVRTIVFRI